jgi:hypothetical protein
MLACAIFSLPAEVAPGRHYFYGFIPACVGVTLVFLLLVLPEARDGVARVKDLICGGLTREKLLAGVERKGRVDRRHRASRGTSTGSLGAMGGEKMAEEV